MTNGRKSRIKSIKDIKKNTHTKIEYRPKEKYINGNIFNEMACFRAAEDHEEMNKEMDEIMAKYDPMLHL